MSVPAGASQQASTTALGGPAIVIVLMLALGATCYLGYAGYLRRPTAYIVGAILAIGLAFLAIQMYR